MKWYGWVIIIFVFGGALLLQFLPYNDKPVEKERIQEIELDEYKFEDSSSPASNIEHLKKLDSVKK